MGDNGMELEQRDGDGGSGKARYSIGVVCRRTGLKSDRLRAWERRYGVVEPERSEGNQRLYTDEDVERLTLLRRATDRGHRIAQIADLSTVELAGMLAEETTARIPEPLRPPTAREVTDAGRFLSDCLAAIQQLDADSLREELASAAAGLSRTAFIQELLVPLIERVGELWAEGGLKVAHEHLATAVVSAFVEGMRTAFDVRPDAPRVVLTTPAGERHELGALLAVATAASDGWDVTYLGPDLPAEEIAAAVRQRRARVVGLSVVHPAENDPSVEAEIRKLRRHLGDDVDIIVGGRAAAAYEEVLTEVGAAVVEDLAYFRGALQALRD